MVIIARSQRRSAKTRLESSELATFLAAGGVITAGRAATVGPGRGTAVTTRGATMLTGVNGVGAVVVDAAARSTAPGVMVVGLGVGAGVGAGAVGVGATSGCSSSLTSHRPTEPTEPTLPLRWSTSRGTTTVKKPAMKSSDALAKGVNEDVGRGMRAGLLIRFAEP